MELGSAGDGRAWLEHRLFGTPKMVITRVLRKPGGERHGERKLALICRTLPEFAAKQPAEKVAASVDVAAR